MFSKLGRPAPPIRFFDWSTGTDSLVDRLTRGSRNFSRAKRKFRAEFSGPGWATPFLHSDGWHSPLCGSRSRFKKKTSYSTKVGIFKWVSQPNLYIHSLPPPLLTTCPDLTNLQNFTVLTQSDFFDSRNLAMCNNVKQNIHFIVTLIMAPLAETLLRRRSAFPGNLKPPFPCSWTHLISFSQGALSSRQMQVSYAIKLAAVHRVTIKWTIYISREFTIYHLLALSVSTLHPLRRERMNKNTERWNKIGREEPEYCARRKTCPNVNLTITDPRWSKERGWVCLCQNVDCWRDVVVIIFSAENKKMPLTPIQNSRRKFAVYPDFSILESRRDGNNFNWIIKRIYKITVTLVG